MTYLLKIRNSYDPPFSTLVTGHCKLKIRNSCDSPLSTLVTGYIMSAQLPTNSGKPHPDEWLRQSSPPRLRGGVRGGVL